MSYALVLTMALVAGDPTADRAADASRLNTFVDVPTLVARGERSYLVQRWDRGIEAFEKAAAANPTIGYVWWRLGNCALMGGEYEKALEAFTKSHELGVYQWRPLKMAHRGESAWGLAATYARLGKRDEALQWTRTALAEGLRDIRRFQAPHFKDLLKDEEFRKLVWADDAKDLPRDEGFRHDLRFLMHEAKRIHFDPFRLTSEAEFDSLAAALEADIPKLSDDKILVRMAAIMRRLGDGHTHIRHNGKPARLGVHLHSFPEGLYIDAALAEHADLVGAKVLRIGDCAADEALQRVEEITSRDNEMNVSAVAPRLLASLRLLRGLGIYQGDGPVPLEVEDATGKTRQVELPIVEKRLRDNDFVYEVPGCEETLPWCMRQRGKIYWFEKVPEERLVFCQINGIGNDAHEKFDKFCKRLFKAVEADDVDALVIDMRYNGGGNTFVNPPLIEGIIRCEKLQEPGKLFVIIGRRTFSAAQNTTSELERRTKAILVGEPTGSNPNFIGESLAIPLPYSGWIASVSDLWWQHSMAMDYRVWTHPQLYAPPTAEAMRAHRDPAMEAIRAYRKQARK